MQCIGRHGADVPSDLRKVIKRATHSEKALHSLAKLLFENPVYESFVGTTQAVDLIQGGVKVNALPELAWAVINHRISVIRSASVTSIFPLSTFNSLRSTVLSRRRWFMILTWWNPLPRIST